MNKESLWSATFGTVLAGYSIYYLVWETTGSRSDLWHGIILLLLGLSYIVLAVPSIQDRFNRLEERRNVRLIGGVLLIGVGLLLGGLFLVLLGAVGLVIIVFTLLGAEWR